MRLISGSSAGSIFVNIATAVDEDSRPADLFVTRGALPRRRESPDLHAEAEAFRLAAKMLAADPAAALQHLPEAARRLCGAGTAGLSLLHRNSAGEAVVRWEIVSGALAPYQGTDTLRNSSPCGLCLDAGATILVSRPERVFAWLREIPPAPVEDLIVPLYDHASRPLGTLWLAHHDEAHFHADDVRIVEQIAGQLVLALKLVRQDREGRQALAMRERAEAAEYEARQALVFKDAVIQEAHHRIKNTLQIAASLLSAHARATSSMEVRLALQESHGRLQLLASAHQLLYAIADSRQHVLMPPLLQTLADALRQSFSGNSDRVRLQVTADSLTLPVDQAITLALLANEAVMNAYKHAFPHDAAGHIAVDLRCTVENEVVLRITDSGVGLRTNPNEGGLGLKLVRTFAAQLQGSLTFTAPTAMTGTVITLTIPQSTRQVPA